MRTVPKHTPGLWEWDESGYSLRPCPKVESPIYRTILELEAQGMVARDCDIKAMIAEGEANRTVIAAAPELLKALFIAEDFMSGFEDDETQVGIGVSLAIIRAAIIRAGGTPA